MLDKFKWDVPVRSSGNNATPYVKLTCRFPNLESKKKEEKPVSTKYSFQLSKGFAEKYELKGKTINLAFSFDKGTELIMATNAPDTIPSYQARNTTGGSFVFQNAKFAQKLFKMMAKTDEKPLVDGTYHLYFHWREELPKPEGKTTIFNLIRREEL